MKTNIKRISRIALALFVVFSLVGLASPLFATPLPSGIFFGTRISTFDTANTYAIADTNYLQGGHMQVANKTARNNITPERRSLGMLVTVIDDDTVASGNQTVTYRLISNRGGTSCATTVTDSSFDGLSTACATTVDANWAVAVPSITSSNIGQFLTTTDGINFSWAAVGTGSGGSFTLLTGTSGTDFNIGTAGSVYTFNLPVADASHTGKLSSTDWTTFNGKQAALGYTPLNPANNLSELTSASTARTNLGLGTAALLSAGDFLATANNLSEISLAGTLAQAAARTNLGLGSLSTLNSINNSNWSGTALATTNGGTGLTSYTTGDLLYASGTNVLSTLAVGTNGQILTVTASGLPAWMANLGGNFDGSRAITRSAVAMGAVGGTTLSDFINNFFFPAVNPTASLALSGSSTRELGASTAVTFTTASITKKTNPITTATITVTGSGATISSGGGSDVPSSGTTTSLNISGSIVTTSGGIGNAGTASNTTQSSGLARSGVTGANTSATFTLTGTDSGSLSGSSSVTISYLPKVYILITSYDYLLNPSSRSVATISNDFVTGTPSACASATVATAPCSILASNSNRTITATLSGQYLYYAVPTSYGISGYNTGSFRQNSSTGTPDSSVGRTTVTNFINSQSYTQNYYIYGFHASSDSVMDSLLTGTLIIYSP